MNDPYVNTNNNIKKSLFIYFYIFVIHIYRNIKTININCKQKTTYRKNIKTIFDIDVICQKLKYNAQNNVIDDPYKVFFGFMIFLLFTSHIDGVK